MSALYDVTPRSRVMISRIWRRLENDKEQVGFVREVDLRGVGDQVTPLVHYRAGEDDEWEKAPSFHDAAMKLLARSGG